MGNNMSPMNGFGIWYLSAVSSIDATTVIMNLKRLDSIGKRDNGR